jgi:hypothetical protein
VNMATITTVVSSVGSLATITSQGARSRTLLRTIEGTRTSQTT